MPMDKSAIEQIQKSEASAVLNNCSVVLDTEVPALAIPKDFNIESLEHLYEYRSRYRGSFITHHINDFVKYTGEDGGHCFIDADNMSAKSIMDLGDTEKPGHAEHTATLLLTKTVPYSSLITIDGNATTQQNIAEWLEDWRDFLRAENSAGEKIDIKNAISAIRTITIDAARKSEHQVKSLSQSRSTMESIEAKSKNAEMPAFFYFKCVPHEGLKEREFMLRLSITTLSEHIKLTLRISRIEAIKEEIANEFKEMLINEFTGSDTKIYIGTFTTRVSS